MSLQQQLARLRASASASVSLLGTLLIADGLDLPSVFFDQDPSGFDAELGAQRSPSHPQRQVAGEDRMQPLNSRHLYTLHADLRLPERDLGQTPLGWRRIFDVTGGRLEGRVTGTLLPSGADWLLVDADGCLRLDVRITAELDDGAMVYMAYKGRIMFPPDVLPLLTSHEAAAEVDPSRYYMRVAPFFETASEKYRWLNHIVAVGVGRITRTGVAYDAYEVL